MIVVFVVILATGAPGAWQTASAASVWAVVLSAGILVGGSVALVLVAYRGRRRGRGRRRSGAGVWASAAACGVAVRILIPSVGLNTQLVGDALFAALFTGIGLATIHALIEDARAGRRGVPNR